MVMGYLLVFVRVISVSVVYTGFAVVGLVLKSAGFISKKRRHHLIAWFTGLWARSSCFLFNIQLEIEGVAKIKKGSLIVANHIGAPDIFVLAKCFPAFFVSKADITEWPLFGLLARLGEVILAKRDQRHQVKEIIAEMSGRLQEDCSVILFPEGQATDGQQVLTFKPSTFAAAIQTECDVVPVTLIYHDDSRPSIACWHEVAFLEHILKLLKNRRLGVTVFVHPAIQGAADRRELAGKSFALINETHAREETQRQSAIHSHADIDAE
jgi:1-acyl-sn-glycerol-3-phosphate acyltransferase